MQRTGLRARAIAGAFGLAALASCNIYNSSLLVGGDAGGGGPPVAYGGGVGWWSKTAPNGCFSAGVPTPDMRPPASAGGGDTIDPLYFAISTMQLGAFDPDGKQNNDAWKGLGFDLDGTCSNSPTCGDDLNSTSCKPNTIALPFDGNNCRDNTFGRMDVLVAGIKEVGQKYGLNDQAFNCALCTGAYTFLFKISDYNGQPDDDQIRIDLYPSPGLEKPLPWDCAASDWASHTCFFSSDAWTIQDDSMDAPAPGPALPNAKLYDNTAYVRENYIVMQLPENALFWFPGTHALAKAFPMRLQKAIVTGKIGKAQDGTWAITDGMIAGRTKEQDLVDGFHLIGFCPSDPNYSLLLDNVKAYLDVLSTGAVLPDTACDAMSVGIGFDARQATAGKLAHVDPLTDCPATTDGGTDGGDEAGDAGTDAAADATGD